MIPNFLQTVLLCLVEKKTYIVLNRYWVTSFRSLFIRDSGTYAHTADTGHAFLSALFTVQNSWVVDSPWESLKDTANPEQNLLYGFMGTDPFF